MTSATLIERVEVGGALHRVRFAVARDPSAAHVAHGQYVEVKVGVGATESRGNFVLTNDPGSEVWELVVRPSPGASEALVAMDIGATVSVSAPIGRGFPYESARGRTLALVTTGSGVAAVLSVLRARVRDGEAAGTIFVHGVRDDGALASLDEVALLQAHGGRVLLALSRAEPTQPNAALNTVKGYVQDALASMSTSVSLAGAELFVAGGSAMIAALRARAPDLGFDVASIRLNFG